MKTIKELPESIRVMMLIIAACVVLFFLVIKVDFFARMYSSFLSIQIEDHGWLDEFISILVIPSFGFAAFSLYRWKELQREEIRRSQMEQALRESEERFRLVFDQSGEGILIAEHESGTIIYANSSVKGLLGYSLAELSQAGMPLLFRHFQALDLARIYAEIPERGDFLGTRISTFTVDRNELVISLRLRYVKILGNNLVYLSFRDMSEKYRLEDAARLSQAKLIQANKMTSLGMLVSGVAHEINNPNNYIMFNSSMLADIWRDTRHLLGQHYREHGEFSLGGLSYPEVESATERLIEGISEGSTRIKTIVDDLRNFARQGPGTDDVVDVNEAVLKAVAILTPQIKKHTSRFSLELTEQEPECRGNLQQLEQVIINLLTNALESLPDKGAAVSISTALTETGAISIDIHDEGCGMDSDTISKLSEPFFTTKSEQGGLGLGLFISQSIINDHHGRLRFESAPGKGTTATIELTDCRQKESDENES